MEEKFTIEPRESIATKEKPTGQKQETNVENRPQIQPSQEKPTEKPRPGRPRKKKRGKIRKTTLAPENPLKRQSVNNVTKIIDKDI